MRNRDRYPDDWEAISLRIRQRGNWCCEWCGVRNGAYGFRGDDGEFHEVPVEWAETLANDGVKMIKIVLTVAHLGAPKPDGSPGDVHDKMDCRDDNLAALCQRCHLNYDRYEHLINAAKTRRAKKIAAGQEELL